MEKTQNQLLNLKNLETVLKKISESDSSNSEYESQEFKQVQDSLNSKLSQSLLSIENLHSSSNQIISISNSDKAKIAEMERRLAKLESLIGTNQVNSSNESYRPILTTLQDLRDRLKLINRSPVLLETSANNLRSLIDTIGKLKKLKEQSSTLNGDNADSYSSINVTEENLNLDNFNSNGSMITSKDQINELYSKIKLIEKFESILPKIILRLKHLNTLHTDALVANESIKDFDSLILTFKTDLKAWQDTLEKLDSKLNLYEKKSQENKSEIQKWIAELQHDTPK